MFAGSVERRKAAPLVSSTAAVGYSREAASAASGRPSSSCIADPNLASENTRMPRTPSHRKPVDEPVECPMLLLRGRAPLKSRRRIPTHHRDLTAGLTPLPYLHWHRRLLGECCAGYDRVRPRPHSPASAPLFRRGTHDPHSGGPLPEGGWDGSPDSGGAEAQLRACRFWAWTSRSLRPSR